MYKHRGFTLVELLVVIVVIAILASITIVSYGKIKDKAYNTTVEAAASHALKIIELAYTSEGRIYINEGDNLSRDSDSLCIGNPADFPATGKFRAGECQTYDRMKASQELWNTYKKYASGNLAVGEIYDGTYANIRGITYVYARSVSTGQYSDYLSYNLIGTNQKCSLPGAETNADIRSWDDGSRATSCWVNLDKMLGEAPLDW